MKKACRSFLRVIGLITILTQAAFYLVSCSNNGLSGGATGAASQSLTGSVSGGTTGTTSLMQMGGGQNFWNQNISQAALDPNSLATITWLVGNGGWGGYVGFGSCNGQAGYVCNTIVVEPIFAVNHTGFVGTPMATFTKATGYYTPDCDNLTQFPLPSGGAVEGSANYTCPSGGSCHLMVYNDSTNTLYESYQSNISGNAMTSLCGVMWNMAPTYTYPTTLRDSPITNIGSGDQCTGADAGGFPMAPFMFSADDIARGSIDHMMRLTLPNSQIKTGVYLRPAVHLGGPTALSTSFAPPYGAHFRLKASVNISGFSRGGQIVATAMQNYGMIIADGGDHALSAVADTNTVNKWTDADVNLTAINSDIATLTPADFDVVYGGASPVSYVGNCTRVPLAN